MIPKLKDEQYVFLIIGLTLAINGLIFFSYVAPKNQPSLHTGISLLPMLNAIANGATFLALLMALYNARKRRIAQHRMFITAAFLFTSVFLVSYLIYHFSNPSTPYGGTGIGKYIYFFILITHIILAVVIVPLALVSVSLALRNKLYWHRKVSRWTMGLWLYVSLTGVIVYILISPYY